MAADYADDADFWGNRGFLSSWFVDIMNNNVPIRVCPQIRVIRGKIIFCPHLPEQTIVCYASSEFEITRIWDFI